MPTFLDERADALARVYAQSLFELVEQQGGREKIEEISSEFDDLVELARENESFREFLRSEILPAAQRAQSLRKMFEGRASDPMLRFLLVLNAKERLSRIASIAAAFDELMEQRFGFVEVDVYTASPLDKPALDALADRIRRILNREPVLHAYVEPEMIGGIKLLIGDQLVDGSVAARLEAMRRRLRTSGAAQVRAASGEILN